MRRNTSTQANWWIAGTILVFVVVCLVWSTTGLDVGGLRDLLRRGHFWSLELTFVLMAALTLREMRNLRLHLPLSTRQWRVLAAIALAGSVMAGGLAQRTNRIYYDEHIYQGIGHNLSELRLAQMCNDGIVEYGQLQCRRAEYNKQPYAYPHVLSIVYRLAGVSDAAAHFVNIGTLGVHALVIGLIAALLFQNARPAIAAAAVFVTIPQQIVWSATAAAEPSAALACSLALLAALWFTNTRSTGALMWTVAATAWAVQFRAESFLIVPLVALVIVLRARDELPRSRMLMAVAVGSALVTLHLAHLVAVRGEGWGAAGDRFSLQYVGMNLRTNGWFYLADWRFPALYGVLGLLGLTRPADGRARVLLGIYFLVFWGVFLLFYAGSYNYGADVRYSLMTYAPVALLAGWAADRLFAALPQARHVQQIGGLAILLHLALYLPSTRAVGEEAWGARADVRFAKEFAGTLPANVLILTHNPHMFHLWGVNASQLYFAANEPDFLTFAHERFAGGVYLHWNFWCNVEDRTQRELCSNTLAQKGGELVFERRERDYRYAFYRLPSPVRIDGRH